MGRLDTVRDASRRLVWWASTPSGLAWLFFAGLLVRLWFARRPGFPIDMPTFRAWADRMATEGPLRMYPADFGEYFIDYPPGYLYVLGALGKLSRLAAGGPPPDFLLKVPPILADLGLAWVAVRLAARLTPAGLGRRLPWRGVAAAAILLNPAVIFVSAVWGQVDSVLAVLVAGGFLLLGTGATSARREAGGLALLGLALITKPQAGFVLPLAVLVLVWRHLRDAVADTRGAGFREVARAVPLALARVAGLGLLTLGFVLVLMVPFGLGPARAVRFYAHAAATYKYTSVWAFNLWGVLGFWKPDSGAGAFKVVGLPALGLGLAAFVVGTAYLLRRAWRALSEGERDGRVLVFGGAAMTCLAFTVLTRIHERYLFLGIACLAPLVAWRPMRRALAVLSVLYFANVYYPYVYYIRDTIQKGSTVDFPLDSFFAFDALYGTAADSPQKKLLSLATAAVCLLVATRGWQWLAVRGADVIEAEPIPAPAVAPLERVPKRWRLELRPVGKRGAALAGAILVLSLATKLVGLASPPGMYFDEVYHARTAGEYLQRKEVYEWTHPPLAKEIMAVFIRGLEDFGVSGRGRAPGGFDLAPVSSDGDDVLWLTGGSAAPGAGEQALLRTGRFDPSACSIHADLGGFRLNMEPLVVAGGSAQAVVGGVAAEGPVLARIDGGRMIWRVPLPERPVAVDLAGGAAFVVGREGGLFLVSGEGAVTTLATGAADVSAIPKDALAWASFPADRKLVSYGTDGAVRHSVTLEGTPGPLLALADGDRILVADTDRDEIEAVDEGEIPTRADEIALGATRLETIPDTGMLWAVRGRDVSLVEPRGLARHATVRLPDEPRTLLADRVGNRMMAVTADGLVCVSGKPTFAWRFGSALFGSFVVMLIALIALRLFGSLLGAGLAALFVSVDGLAFTMSRIAMNDSYVAAFILAAWFCALSCLYRWGARPADEAGVRTARSRPAALGWLLGCGIAAGCALGSKWVGLYALGGIGLLFAWDLLSRRRDGVASLAGGFVPSVGVLGLALVALPLGIYVATYAPYFGLGHSFGELVGLQRGMYGYHAHLDATHPYGSPWYGWPIGRRAVWLYLGERLGQRAEIWTIANPVVFLAGLAALVALAREAIVRRSVALALVPGAILVQFLPWTLVSRVTFLYHYLPIVPFLAAALGWWLACKARESFPRGHRVMQITVAAATVGVFLWLLPLLDGWYLPEGYGRLVREWLGWQF